MCYKITSYDKMGYHFIFVTYPKSSLKNKNPLKLLTVFDDSSTRDILKINKFMKAVH